VGKSFAATGLAMSMSAITKLATLKRMRVLLEVLSWCVRRERCDR
jgi:hypothetical protein